MTRKTVEERIREYTDDSAGPDACWPWLGSMAGGGSAMLYAWGVLQPARRVVWKVLGHELPKGITVTATCGHRTCVNPKHLTTRAWGGGDDATRFWSYVEKTDGCWIWKSDDIRGYGRFFTQGKAVFAHRFSYELANGIKVPRDRVVMHKCDNPQCVRPDHLEEGSFADNVHDCIAKGRNSRGERHSILSKKASVRRKAGLPPPVKATGRTVRRHRYREKLMKA